MFSIRCNDSVGEVLGLRLLVMVMVMLCWCRVLIGGSWVLCSR